MKAKRRLLKYPDGFKAQFYTLSEIVTPVLAWGFFGTFTITWRLYSIQLDLSGHHPFLLNLRSGRESQHLDALLQGPDAGLCARPLQLSDCQVDSEGECDNGLGDLGWRFLNSHRSTFFLRYTDLDSVIEDVVRLSRQRLESVERRLKAEEEEVGDTNLRKSEFGEVML